MSSTPRLSRLEVGNYRAFAEPAEIELAPLTFLVGRNNMGKSSLLRAPRFLSHALDPTAKQPFDLHLDGLDYGDRLTDLCYAEGYTFTARLTVEHAAGATTVDLEAAAPSELNYAQIINRVALGTDAEAPRRWGREADWAVARAPLAERAELAGIHAGCRLLTAARELPVRGGTIEGAGHRGVGARGEHLAGLMWAASRSGVGGLDALNVWLARLGDGARAGVERTRDNRLLITVERPGEPTVPLIDCGAGVGQVLPVIAALVLSPADARPALLAIEQPEAELHPAVHAEVAELLIASATADGGPRLLVETHSDPLLLRIRAAIAEQRLSPDDVNLYVVEDHPDAVGSRVRRIPFDDRGTPEWWPRGLFAEPADEFRRLMRALARREGRR